MYLVSFLFLSLLQANATFPQPAANFQSTSDWHLTFQIPEKSTFSWAVQKAIDTGLVCAKPRRDITQTIRTLMLQYSRYPSSEAYTTISRKLIEKFPSLHDGGNSGFVSVVVMY